MLDPEMRRPPPCSEGGRTCLGSFLHQGNGGKFKEGSESKHLLDPVYVVEERYMPQHTHMQVRVEGSGSMEEKSRKVQIASTYSIGIVARDGTSVHSGIST